MNKKSMIKLIVTVWIGGIILFVGLFVIVPLLKSLGGQIGGIYESVAGMITNETQVGEVALDSIDGIKGVQSSLGKIQSLISELFG